MRAGVFAGSESLDVGVGAITKNARVGITANIGCSLKPFCVRLSGDWLDEDDLQLGIAFGIPWQMARLTLEPSIVWNWVDKEFTRPAFVFWLQVSFP